MTDSPPDDPDRIAACHAALAARCEAERRWTSGDGRVDAATAADLIGVALGTLRQWRYLREGPTPYRIGGRVSYSLRDVAEWIEGQRK